MKIFIDKGKLKNSFSFGINVGYEKCTKIKYLEFKEFDICLSFIKFYFIMIIRTEERRKE